ncbi:glycosyltransferase family 4 protein [Devosia sp. WQ 349]|uniref:glycosyltransferase family 4 protein n=1 Tax=Devosia sp. WQ 349K1 TaxID=2800329 RepID=UPI0019084E32|nr:glycosyltransferase family 4 protein [Devosia sp. WQ 349K1]MBK1795680.1 glycosyltransferase family 4 protein [Devosia sp. WQ 349K1]
MRILQVLRAPVGGLFRHVCDLTEELSARGHEIGIVVDALASDAQTEAKLKAIEQFTSLGVYRHPMPRVFGLGDLKTPFAVNKLAKRLNVDVIHGHGAKGGFYARLARLGGNKARTVYTPHGGVLHFPSTSRSGQIFHKLERALMRKTDAIIFESHFALKTYSALIGAPTCPTSVIYNGLRPAEFEPLEHRHPLSDFVFVGELRELKGIFHLVEALAQVQRADDSRPTLVVAGDGPSRPELEQLISTLGLTDQVRFLGSRPAREAFALGECAVLPSLAESLPYVVMEATAAGLPVISTRVGGIAEIFGPTQDRLIPAGDTTALANAMQAHLNNPQIEINAMHARRSYVSELFTLDSMTTSILKIYQPSK